MAAEKKKYGFLGMGIMGSAMASNLLKAGLPVTVWNRTTDKCRCLIEEGAGLGESPADVVRRSDIIFSCLADPAALEQVVFGPSGVLEGIAPGKGYIDMSTVDAETSLKIHKAVRERGGEYLEAPVSGSKRQAEEGTLLVLAAGSEALLHKAQEALSCIGKKTAYLGDVGKGVGIKLVVNMVLGNVLVCLGEGLALAESSGLKQEDLLTVLEDGPLACPLITSKGKAMVQGDYSPPSMQISLLQKDLRLAIAMGDSTSQPLPLANATNEVLMRAKAEGYGKEDTAAVYKVLRQNRTVL